MFHFNALEYLNVSETQLALSVVLAVCTGILAYNWIKKYFRNLPPGPRGLPFLGYQPFLGSQPHKAVAELRKKYGSIIGLYMGSTYTVFLTEYDVMKETIGQNAAMDRPDIFTYIPGGLGIGSQSGEEWQEQRRFCVHAMRDLGLGKGPWETLILEEVQEFVGSLRKYKSKPMNVSFLLISSVNNNIISLLIGRKMKKGMDDEKIKLMVDLTNTILVNTATYDSAYVFPWWRNLLALFKIGAYHEVDDLVEKFAKFIRNEMKLHETSDELKNTEDFIQKYQQQIMKKRSTDGEKHYFSEINLRGNLLVLFLGASDTISTSLNWIFNLMAAHPDIQRKVHAELDNVIGKDRTAYYDDRKTIPYTSAVIMETLRFAVTVPMAGPRLSREDMTLRGYTIPKGANIVTNIWALHNDPNYWEHPEKFNPERFLSDDGKEVVKPKSYAPFTTGKRNCPGETVAYMEIFLYFTSVMQKFEVRAPEGKHITFDYDYGLVCNLKPRDLCFIERK